MMKVSEVGNLSFSTCELIETYKGRSSVEIQVRG